MYRISFIIYQYNQRKFFEYEISPPGEGGVMVWEIFSYLLNTNQSSLECLSEYSLPI